jgi:hypothetical protein
MDECAGVDDQREREKGHGRDCGSGRLHDPTVPMIQKIEVNLWRYKSFLQHEDNVAILWMWLVELFQSLKYLE